MTELTDKIVTWDEMTETVQNKEQNAMLNEQLMTEDAVFADRTYKTERGLSRFLQTLTPAQLAEAQVMQDDDGFVVFYPVVREETRAHFDGGDSSLAAGGCSPWANSPKNSNISFDRNAVLAALLVGVQL